MTHEEYWQECIANAAEEAGATLTHEQINEIAGSVHGAHENYGMAFYSPPASDRIHAVEREQQAKYDRLKADFDAYTTRAESAIKRALHMDSDANVAIERDGTVNRYGGRIERIL
jgi:hypothetical protein